MLYLGDERTIENTTVFRDHEKPEVYWYLPNHIAIAQQDGRPVFSFLPYRIPKLNNRGGAFLNFQANLQLPKQLEDTIKSKIKTAFGDWAKKVRGTIHLNPAPWDEGTAECMILDLKGSGGASNVPAVVSSSDKGQPKAVQFVDRILGTVRPSLDNRNNAVFSIQLHQEGAEFLQAMWGQRKKDFSLGVFYSLKYTGLAPSFKAHISADMKRLYTHLGLNAEAQIKFVKVGIEAGIETAIRDQIIKYETTDFKKGQENKELAAWLRQFFTDKVISDWMQPVLTPVRVADTTTGTRTRRFSSLYDDYDDDLVTSKTTATSGPGAGPIDPAPGPVSPPPNAPGSGGTGGAGGGKEVDDWFKELE
jgi:hypothetical protein